MKNNNLNFMSNCKHGIPRSLCPLSLICGGHWRSNEEVGARGWSVGACEGLLPTQFQRTSGPF